MFFNFNGQNIANIIWATTTLKAEAQSLQILQKALPALAAQLDKTRAGIFNGQNMANIFATTTLKAEAPILQILQKALPALCAIRQNQGRQPLPGRPLQRRPTQTTSASSSFPPRNDGEDQESHRRDANGPACT
jgi:deferrochelatase/peroxidase EfeB